MALFTDSDVVTLDDLLQFESSLVQVSSTHGIDITTKIKLAVDGIGDQILLFLLRAGPSDPQWFSRNTLGLTTVVVTPSIYRWICVESLSRTFAEAYNVQLNTRFQGKWEEYQKQSAACTEIVFASGIGIVFSPLPRPSLPGYSTSAGTMSAQSLFVQTAWTNELGQESALSPVNGLVLNGSSQVEISMGDLLPAIPAAATGWNVYISETQTCLTRQNLAPNPVGQVWQMPQTGTILGQLPTGGQAPARFVSSNRRWQRG